MAEGALSRALVTVALVGVNVAERSHGCRSQICKHRFTEGLWVAKVVVLSGTLLLIPGPVRPRMVQEVELLAL